MSFGKTISPITTNTSIYAYDKRVALLGTPAAGKTTTAALIIHTVNKMSAQLPGFTADVIENSSRILEYESMMRRGYFPEKTRAYQSYAVEAGLVCGYETKDMFGRNKIKNVQVPLCDIAGEDILQLIAKYNKNKKDILARAAYHAAMALLDYVKKAHGYMIVCPANKAFIGGRQYDTEIGAPEVGQRNLTGIAFDPDVNTHRILSEIIDHKKKNHKKIDAIGVIISKWDDVAADAEQLDMDILDETGEGLKQFMTHCYGNTYRKIKRSLQEGTVKDVRYFPTFVEIRRDPKTLEPIYHPGTKKKWVLTDEYGGLKYQEKGLVDLINWLGTFAP